MEDKIIYLYLAWIIFLYSAFSIYAAYKLYKEDGRAMPMPIYLWLFLITFPWVIIFILKAIK